MKAQYTEFGKSIKKKLIDYSITQDQLCAEVSEKTGLYCDSSYLNRIMTGKRGVREGNRIVEAIKEILKL